MKTVLITGANRGLGLEFCRQYSNLGWHVLACCRQPEQAIELNKLVTKNTSITIHKINILNRKEIDSLANNLCNTTVDLVIANAGVYGDSGSHGFGNLDYDEWINVLETKERGFNNTQV